MRQWLKISEDQLFLIFLLQYTSLPKLFGIFRWLLQQQIALQLFYVYIAVWTSSSSKMSAEIQKKFFLFFKEIQRPPLSRPSQHLRIPTTLARLQPLRHHGMLLRRRHCTQINPPRLELGFGTNTIKLFCLNWWCWILRVALRHLVCMFICVQTSCNLLQKRSWPTAQPNIATVYLLQVVAIWRHILSEPFSNFVIQMNCYYCVSKL